MLINLSFGSGKTYTISATKLVVILALLAYIIISIVPTMATIGVYFYPDIVKDFIRDVALTTPEFYCTAKP